MKSCNYPYFCKSIMCFFFLRNFIGYNSNVANTASKIHIEDKATLPEDVFFAIVKDELNYE